MDIRPVVVALAVTLTAGCAATPGAAQSTHNLSSVVPILATRSVSLYSDHQRILVPARAPTTALGVEVPENLHVRAIVVTFSNGEQATLTTKTQGRVDIPGPARQLREVELIYVSEAPVDTYAKVRLYDLSVPEELAPPKNTARR